MNFIRNADIFLSATTRSKRLNIVIEQRVRPITGGSVTYYLIYKYDRKEAKKVLTLPFSTESEAVIAACAIIAEGNGWDLEIIDHDSETVANDAEIRNRCKRSRTP